VVVPADVLGDGDLEVNAHRSNRETVAILTSSR
jgi:hypothetical protein